MVNPNRVFIGMPIRKKFAHIYTHGIVPTLEKIKLEPWKADEEPNNIDIMCKICEHLQESQYAIINITDWNPNVLFELGLAYGLGKTVVIIKYKESGVPVDLKGMEY
jgi:nucleoside 2-deoxyribosyltransferase